LRGRKYFLVWNRFPAIAGCAAKAILPENKNGNIASLRIISAATLSLPIFSHQSCQIVPRMFCDFANLFLVLCPLPTTLPTHSPRSNARQHSSARLSGHEFLFSCFLATLSGKEGRKCKAGPTQPNPWPCPSFFTR
jgi:hypothetical protein